MLRRFLDRYVKPHETTPVEQCKKVALSGNPVHVYNAGERVNPARLPRYLARKKRLLQAIEQEEAKENPERSVLNAYRLELMELNRKLG